MARRRPSRSSEILEYLRRWPPSASSRNPFGTTVPSAKANSRAREVDLDAFKQAGRDGGNELGEYRLANKISYVRDVSSWTQLVETASLRYEMMILVWAVRAQGLFGATSYTKDSGVESRLSLRNMTQGASMIRKNETPYLANGTSFRGEPSTTQPSPQSFSPPKPTPSSRSPSPS